MHSTTKYLNGHSDMVGGVVIVGNNTELRDRLISTAHPKARSGIAAELVLAADQFIATPAGRLIDATRAHALGDEMRTAI